MAERFKVMGWTDLMRFDEHLYYLYGSQTLRRARFVGPDCLEICPFLSMKWDKVTSIFLRRDLLRNGAGAPRDSVWIGWAGAGVNTSLYTLNSFQETIF